MYAHLKEAHPEATKQWGTSRIEVMNVHQSPLSRETKEPLMIGESKAPLLKKKEEYSSSIIPQLKVEGNRRKKENKKKKKPD